jgi:nucleoside phosphorylase
LGPQWERPGDDTDIIMDEIAHSAMVPHPYDPERRNGKPRIFLGPIASASKLLINPKKRDALRDKYKVKAIEMEGSGIADASWNLEKSCLIVRGACDYCNQYKNDTWHKYASIVAASYARALIEIV